jgi:hypothetical protein
MFLSIAKKINASFAYFKTREKVKIWLFIEKKSKNYIFPYQSTTFEKDIVFSPKK